MAAPVRAARAKTAAGRCNANIGGQKSEVAALELLEAAETTMQRRPHTSYARAKILRASGRLRRGGRRDLAELLQSGCRRLRQGGSAGAIAQRLAGAGECGEASASTAALAAGRGCERLPARPAEVAQTSITSVGSFCPIARGAVRGDPTGAEEVASTSSATTQAALDLPAGQRRGEVALEAIVRVRIANCQSCYEFPTDALAQQAPDAAQHERIPLVRYGDHAEEVRRAVRVPQHADGQDREDEGPQPQVRLRSILQVFHYVVLVEQAE
mmetsp:Transcript_43989/g.122353  ORF Transcript_43989/g.122353 Transcript_43989/m.122353 type:complete len:270 (+) Transcript_43989:75-884(+)